jgi:hypothetical protein
MMYASQMFISILSSFSRFREGVFFLLLGLSVSACDAEFDAPAPKVSDFAKSEIISNGPAIANGSSELLVVVNLMNSDGSPVKLFKPIYYISAGAGVRGAECTTSNANGVSTCVLKATQAGFKRFKVTNIKRVDLQKDLLFIPPTPPGVTASVVSSANRQVSSAGYELSGTAGSLQSSMVRTNSAGWKLYGGAESSAITDWK